MYERFCLVASALKLHAWQDDQIREFLEDSKARMESKAVRLRGALPGITIASSRDAISRASAMLSWKHLESTFEQIETQQDLEDDAWQLIDLAAACYEPSVDDMPLAALPRVLVRTFADRLCSALAIDAPHAYELTAQLFRAQSWSTLAGPKLFVPIAEPLYTYSATLIKGEEYAWIEPCHAARQHDDEFEALTMSRQLVFQGDVAQNESVDRPSLLCAASTLAICRLMEEQYELVDWKGRAALKEFDAIYPADCRRPLAPGSNTHRSYVRLRTALYAAYLHTGDMDQACAEREILVARGREYSAEYERLLRAWAPPHSKARVRTTLRIVQ